MTGFAFKPKVIALWVLYISAIIFAYFPTFVWMIWRFEEKNSYSAHGYLIPFISLFLIYQIIKEDGPIESAYHSSGWLLLIGSLFFHMVAGTADVASLSGLSLLTLFLGITILHYGVIGAKRLWFPILFLFFMVPLPDFMISTLNFKLKFWASDVAAALLNFTGFPAIRDGSFMLFGDERLAIGDVCSGLRSLISLIALGVLYTWIIRKEGWKQIGLLLFAILPAAVIGNGLRISIVSYLVAYLGGDTVFKPILGSWDLHLFTGAVIFLGAFGILYAVQQFGKMIFKNKKQSTITTPSPIQSPLHSKIDHSQAPSISPWLSKNAIFITLCIVCVGVITQLFLFKQPIRHQSDLTRTISNQLGPWHLVREKTPSAAEYEGLETTDIIKRNYFNGENTIELVVAYIPRSNRKSAHAQEACLRGSGAMVSGIKTGLLKNSPVIATQISIDHRNQQSRVFYWYKIGNTYTSEYLKSNFLMYLSGILGRKQKGAALVRLLTSKNPGENEEKANERLEDFTKYLLPELTSKLP